MIFYDMTQPKQKNKTFFAANGNKAGIVFIDCNIKVISSGFAELTEAIYSYIKEINSVQSDTLTNIICVFKRIIDLIKYSKKHWQSMNKISIGVICTYENNEDEKIIYSIVAPSFFPVEKIEQTL